MTQESIRRRLFPSPCAFVSPVGHTSAVGNGAERNWHHVPSNHGRQQALDGQQLRHGLCTRDGRQALSQSARQPQARECLVPGFFLSWRGKYGKGLHGSCRTDLARQLLRFLGWMPSLYFCTVAYLGCIDLITPHTGPVDSSKLLVAM